MTLAKTWQKRALLVGGIWSALHITMLSALSDLPWLRNVELGVKDALLRLDVTMKDRFSKQVSNKSKEAIVIIDMENAQDYGLERAEAYAGLIEHLIQSGSRGVLLTLPHSIANAPLIPDTASKVRDKLPTIEDPIKKLINDRKKNVVLATKVYTIPRGKIVFPLYNKYLDLGSNNISSDNEKDLTDIQGFFEFFPIFNSKNKFNPIRYPYLALQDFYLEDQVNKSAKFISSTCLAFKKFQSPQTESCNKFPGEIQLKFLDPLNAFNKIPINRLCNVNKANCQNQIDPEIKKEINGKFILLGLPEDDSSYFQLPSPFGKLASVEMQANLLASIIDNSFYRVLGFSLSFGVILAGAALIISLFLLISAQPKKRLLIYGSMIIIGVPIIYSGVIVLAAYFNLILPIVLPISAWILIGNSTIISLLIWRYQEQVSQQKQKLVERTAILSETQKLLSRVATDIHDRPLQELKLVMDRIEELAYDGAIDPRLLRMKHSRIESISLVEKLSNIGQDIRNHLNDIQTIAQKKWTISPELANGLANGIEHRLNLLVSDGKLRLNVTRNIFPLKEPALDITWINDREDIFRFFKEAINNVMKHAQPFNGDATGVTIFLKQEGNQCTLMVMNDGSKTAPAKPNGTGTKNMETVAAGLPNGAWQREWLLEGGVSVHLRWTMPSD